MKRALSVIVAMFSLSSPGSETPARNMGSRVNSESGEICPSVSLDGKYFFFTSRRRGRADIYWMTTDVIRDLEPQDLSLPKEKL